jgi:hypothetical protein
VRRDCVGYITRKLDEWGVPHGEYDPNMPGTYIAPDKLARNRYDPIFGDQLFNGHFPEVVQYPEAGGCWHWCWCWC